MPDQLCPSCGVDVRGSATLCRSCGFALTEPDRAARPDAGAELLGEHGPLDDAITSRRIRDGSHDSAPIAWSADGQAAQRGRRRTQAFATRLATTRALVGFTEADEALVAATRDVVLAAAGGIIDAFYTHLLAYPETAFAFSEADGRIDRELVAARHESLRAWLIAAVEAPLDERLATYLAGIARAHTGRGEGTGARVKGRYMLASMSFLQTSLIAVLGVSGLDAELLLETVSAWNKLLMIHLDLFLAVYGGAGGTAHWY